MTSDESIVVSAPSVEEAVIIGLTRLTALRDEVDIEVLDEGTKGFLGLGSRAAQVRLTRRPKEAGARDAVLAAAESATSEPAAVSVKDQEPTPQQTAPDQTSDTVAHSPVSTSVSESVAASAGASSEAPSPSEPVAPEPAVSEPEKPAKVEQTAVAEDQPASQAAPQTPAADGLDRALIEATAREIIDNLLSGLNVDAAIEWLDEDRPTLWVSVGGKDADALVGPRARNLHALQYLFRSLIYHRVDGRYNVVVDADGYRRRRRRSLESMARERADRAVAQGQVVRLRPMPAHERRIIHIALREDDRVTTESVGRGRDRAVTVVPVGAASQDNGS